MIQRFLILAAACLLGSGIGARIDMASASPLNADKTKIRLLVLGGGLNTRHLFAHNSGILCDRLRYAVPTRWIPCIKLTYSSRSR